MKFLLISDFIFLKISSHSVLQASLELTILAQAGLKFSDFPYFRCHPTHRHKHSSPHPLHIFCKASSLICLTALPLPVKPPQQSCILTFDWTKAWKQMMAARTTYACLHSVPCPFMLASINVLAKSLGYSAASCDCS